MADHDFETVSSETAYRGNILALRVDQVRMPGGNIAKREVVEHYGAVAVVAVDDGGRVAMVYQYRHPIGRRLWELPAGLLDEPGEDPTEAAARELREETGLTAERWDVLVDLMSSPGFSDEALRVYLARTLADVGRPQGHDEEADMEVHWVHIADAVQQVLSGEIVNSTAVAGILAAHAVIVDDKSPRPVDVPFPDRPTAFAAGKARS
ncbi:NUDIX domain-containing protein [Mycolicibacterium aichiense]|uniref:NUDIX domain-containing protein n=1 Tax=Mycolicibacterium aichiense TaxID=1799 RepID=UPI003D66A95D